MQRSLEVGTGFEPVYTALQAVASPLGHPTAEATRVSRPAPLPSGRRDSNPRPSPWQGDALPTALRPHDPLPFPARARQLYPTRCMPSKRGNIPVMSASCRDRVPPAPSHPNGCPTPRWARPEWLLAPRAGRRRRSRPAGADHPDRRVGRRLMPRRRRESEGLEGPSRSRGTRTRIRSERSGRSRPGST